MSNILVYNFISCFYVIADDLKCTIDNLEFKAVLIFYVSLCSYAITLKYFCAFVHL